MHTLVRRYPLFAASLWPLAALGDLDDSAAVAHDSRGAPA
jgi:hypothetical protein